MSKLLSALIPMSLKDEIKQFLISEGFQYDNLREHFYLEFKTDDFSFSTYVFEQRIGFHLYFNNDKSDVTETFTHDNDFDNFKRYYDQMISLSKEKINELF